MNIMHVCSCMCIMYSLFLHKYIYIYLLYMYALVQCACTLLVYMYISYKPPCPGQDDKWRRIQNAMKPRTLLGRTGALIPIVD